MRSDPHEGAHLSDDQLMETYVLTGDSRHLTACPECCARYDELAGALEQIRGEAAREADAVFTAERLHEQRDRILRRLERQGHLAEVLMFPHRSGSQQPAQRLLGPARRWVAGAAAAGLVAGLFLGFAVDRRVGSAVAAPDAIAPAAAAAVSWQIAAEPPAVRDEQIITEIEDALTGPRRVLELNALDAMTTPPELQEASFVPR